MIEPRSSCSYMEQGSHMGIMNGHNVCMLVVALVGGDSQCLV